jgi:hypothetical protein
MNKKTSEPRDEDSEQEMTFQRNRPKIDDSTKYPSTMKLTDHGMLREGARATR